MGDLEGLKKVLRSLVVSTPTTMDAATLLRDYRRMLGEPLPCTRHGYRDPVLFLRERCSDCFLGPQSNPVLTLIVPDQIKHIDQLVQSQKMPSKQIRGKRRSVPESIIRKTNTNLVSSTFSRPQKVEEIKSNGITKYSRPASSIPVNHYQATEAKKPEPVTHKPQVTVTQKPQVTVTQKPQVTATQKPVTVTQKQEPVKCESVDKLSVKMEALSNGHGQEEPEGAYSRQRLQRFLQKRMPVYQSQRLSGGSRESLQDDDSGRQTSSSLSSRSSAALGALQAELARLVARRPGGVWCSQLLRLYEEEYGRELNFARFRYPSVSACACAVEALVATRAPNGDWLLRARGPGAGAGVGAGGGGGGGPAPALRLRRAPRDRGSLASLAPLDPDEALPGIDYDPDVFPADCLSFLESVPAGSVADVAPGDMLELAVGEVYSPSHLWVLRLGPDFDLMEEFMDQMTEYYTKGEGKDRVLAAGARRPGQYCSSVFEGDWHRSLIVQLVDSDTVKVRHVDYGTVDTVPCGALRPLRREWAALPAQAVRARLAGLRPAAASRRWPRAAAAHCLRLVRERRLVGNVVAVDREESILELFLIDTSTEEDVNITDELIRAGHADPRPGPALGARESYLFPLFPVLEAGATPNYAEIHALLRDGIALEFVDSYRRHVPSLLPSDDSDPEPAPAPPGPRPGPGPGRTSELGSSASPSPSPPPSSPSPPPSLANRVPLLPLVRLPPRDNTLSPSPTPSPASSHSPATQVPRSPTPSPAPAPSPAARPALSQAMALPQPSCATAALSQSPCATTALSQPPCPTSAPSQSAYAAAAPLQPPCAAAAPPQPPCSAAAPPQTPCSAAAPPQTPCSAAAPPQPPCAAPAPAAPPCACPGRAHPAACYALPCWTCARGAAPRPAPACEPYARYGPPRPPGVFYPQYPPATFRFFVPGPFPPQPAFGPGAAVRLSAEECEVFELLSRVDPGAAHRYMRDALRRARGPGPGGPGPGPGGPGPPPPLNPEAAEFRLRPPPGFEHRFP